jgi:hypothetical protein
MKNGTIQIKNHCGGGGGKTFVSLEFIIYVSACAFFIGKIFVKFLPGKYGF